MSYETDIYMWSCQNAELLEQKRFSEVDLVNVIEEIKELGNNKVHALKSYLSRLIHHLLKWKYQPGYRQFGNSSWEQSIDNSRIEIEELLNDVPSLKSKIDTLFEASYKFGRKKAIKETKLNSSIFPESCEWTLEQVLNEDFYPE
jgi:hypothetical protein